MGIPPMDTAILCYYIDSERFAVVFSILFYTGFDCGFCVACISHIDYCCRGSGFISRVFQTVLEIIDAIPFRR